MTKMVEKELAFSTFSKNDAKKAYFYKTNERSAFYADTDKL